MKRSILGLPDQIARLLVVFVVFIAGALAVRTFVVPASLKETGKHRASTEEREGAKEPKYAGGTQCTACHDAHDTKAGGPNCLSCHTTNGGAGVAYEYIDALFKGVGPDNAAPWRGWRWPRPSSRTG